MNSDIVSIETRPVWTKVILIVAIIAAVLFGWIAVRRQIGGLIAESTRATDPAAVELVPIAKGLAPGDPVTMWLDASIQNQTFTADAQQKAISLLEDTVRASPYDYRWWIELGRAYEQADKLDKANEAFKHAVELAPVYTFPRWQLGNFYLRRGRVDEAMAELKLATVNNLTYREQVFGLAWDYFDHDPAKVEALASDGADVTTTLAMFYSQRGQAADALRVWNKLSPEEKKKYPQISNAVAQGLFEKKFYPEALEFARSLDIDPDAQPETVTNGGFEKPIASSSDVTYFGWKFAKTDGKLDALPDGLTKHTGGKSLRLAFKNYIKPDLFTAGQDVVVRPGKAYSLSFWIRTDGLRSAGGPQLEIVNANDDRILVTSKAFPQGTNDWEQISLDFTAPENCTAIIIRTTRGFCGDGCPIVGTLWYDDFSLTAR